MELLERFQRAKRNLEFIDNLQKQIIFSNLYQEREKGNLPLLADWYELSEEHVKDEASFLILKSMDIKGLDKGKELFSGYDNGLLDPILKKDKEWEETGEKQFNGIDKYIDSRLVSQTMAVKCRMINYLSLVNYKMNVHDIYKMAKEGDEESLLKLARMDKTIMLVGWVQELLKEKQYSGDWEFFKRLGKEISKEPFKGIYPLVKAEMLAEYFWDELKEWKYEDIWKLFHEHELIGKEMDLPAFKMFLYRKGLKKYSK